ncbi:MAG TPA: PadR family transcriptional regulator [Nocardioidaceae bacterium]|nr:PadR family transcriptional regulator [Nocardioidaceae bacterium]
MGRSPWDGPWDNPRGQGGSSGQARGQQGHGQGHWQGHWQGRRSSGPPPWVQGLIGLAQSGGAMKMGPKVRRGDVRAAILDVLAVEPMNGYQIIQQIAERSGGAWKPSPGSVYPTVQQLEDEGLVEGHEEGGRRLLRLSDQGRAYVEEHPEEMAGTWRAFDEAEQEQEEHVGDLKPVIGQVMGAVWQVVVSGTRQQQAEAADILVDTRRKLYGLLAEGESE